LCGCKTPGAARVARLIEYLHKEKTGSRFQHGNMSVSARLWRFRGTGAAQLAA
jgi:hypothetical protein